MTDRPVYCSNEISSITYRNWSTTLLVVLEFEVTSSTEMTLLEKENGLTSKKVLWSSSTGIRVNRTTSIRTKTASKSDIMVVSNGMILTAIRNTASYVSHEIASAKSVTKRRTATTFHHSEWQNQVHRTNAKNEAWNLWKSQALRNTLVFI